MGILNNNAMEASSGISVTGAYGTFGADQVVCRKIGADNYTIIALAKFYKDQASYDAGKEWLYQKSYVITGLTTLQISGNLFVLLYDTLKVDYPNYTDV